MVANAEVGRVIIEQKANYCRFIDTRQWDAWSRLFDESVRLRFFDAHGGELARFSSAADYVAAAKAYVADSHSHHRVWDPQLTVRSASEVAAEWEMEDFIVFLPGDSSRPRFHHGGGRYYETWQLREGKWVITDLELRRRFLQASPQEPLA